MPPLPTEGTRLLIEYASYRIVCASADTIGSSIRFPGGGAQTATTKLWRNLEWNLEEVVEDTMEMSFAPRLHAACSADLLTSSNHIHGMKRVRYILSGMIYRETNCP